MLVKTFAPAASWFAAEQAEIVRLHYQVRLTVAFF